MWTALTMNTFDDREKDFEARYDLAVAQFAAGEREAAIDQLLAIFKANRGWNEEAARKWRRAVERQSIEGEFAAGSGTPGIRRALPAEDQSENK